MEKNTKLVKRDFYNALIAMAENGADFGTITAEQMKEYGCDRVYVEPFKENPNAFLGWIYITISFCLIAFGLYFFDMVDKTLPLYGTEHFKRDMSVAGEIFRRMYPMLTSPNENDRLTAARAFRVGLAALENREIDL